jgi:hypothetical protein
MKARMLLPLSVVAGALGAFLALRPHHPPSAAVPTGASVNSTGAEVHRRYERAFDQEAPDPTWAQRAKAIADAKLPALLPEGSAVRSFECRSTLCRLETSHRDVPSYFQFAKSVFVDSGAQLWNAPTYSAPLNDNVSEGLMVSYIAREGHALPRVD